MKNNKTFLTIVKITISLAILVFLIRKVDFNTLKHQFAVADKLLIFLALAIALAPVILSAARLRMVLKTQGIEINVWPAISLTFVGGFFSIFLLGSTGGDAAKFYYMLKRVPGRKIILLFSVLMDRLIGIFVLVGFSVAAIYFERQFFLNDLRIRAISLALIASFIAGAASLGAGMFLPVQRLTGWMSRLRIKDQIISQVAALSDGFHQLRKNSRITLLIFAMTVLIHASTILSGYFLAMSLQLHISITQVAIILAVVLIVVSIPISIGGHGIREGMFILLFSAFGLTSGTTAGAAGYETALSYSIMFFALQCVWCLVGGIIYLMDTPDNRLISIERNIFP